ncbi:hypothetical protein COW36_22975 [bacterium (Candidatus Blackallbacteria) CG17_big_fil_post_rev_8_21_14_2_50_48_46]|uniref:Membrane dipeptidase n=1 Tax=bacterium (Candidatus Blackallbacteria) CG17_big_fil_post_rev_8_21_14_2_50_48_46 TaxID=2014261 RepID=A0A2M7FXU5_9BACT|nr:MAG: hypothetical protein COW64_16045 [bacterium (Candidatus Blackallbacteria) CG18_big_fil_WC_8_21_14_2_50_49_26]PIW14114.1 MAG: hypothetical protein COW36_22975 [bacterium (Candidatus Blackallbacteria) CG17_big_fil_post_rev_8_21_14_2_50_48_46]PIW45844.1 MAG: hypothetical protein COW20_18640 [bacterium (Candidatus Blackallbacteria) CG13_big_fil_rev_8_21_14_2_50_49_14]
MSSKAVILLGASLIMMGGAAMVRYSVESPVPVSEVSVAGLQAQKTSQASAEPIRPSALPTVSADAEWRARVRQAVASANPSSAPSSEASGNPSASGSPGPAGTPTPIMLLDHRPSASPSASASVAASPMPSPSGPLDLKTLHAQAVVVDTHVETPLLLTETRTKLDKNPRGQVDLQRLKEGGVDVVFFSVFVNPWRYRKLAKSQADFIIKTIKQQVAAHPDKIELAYSYPDIQRIVAQGKIAGLMGMEGGDPLGSSLDNVDYFYKQGVRYLSPTWSTHTLLGDSASQRPRWKGLSKFGKEVIQRMNKLGMLVDVSHISDAAFYDVLKTSTQPVIASHSGIRSVRMHARNLSNEMLKLLADKGGTVGIYFYPPFIDVRRSSNLAKVVDHIDAAVKLVGASHVGLGSDFDGLDAPPPVGLENAAKFPAITAELRKRGYSDTQIQQVLGGSFMRVFEQVLR